MMILQMIYNIFKKTWWEQEIKLGLRKKIDIIGLIQQHREYDNDEFDELLTQAFAEGFYYRRTATGVFERIY